MRAALLPLALLAACPKQAPAPSAPAEVPAPEVVAPVAPAYPPAARGDTVDTWYDTVVADPYRWMEDLDSEPVRQWIEAENALTRSWLDRLPWRAAIATRLQKLWTFERWSNPKEAGGRYFFEYNDGTWDQPRLFVAEGVAGAPRMLLDPRDFRDDGTASVPQWVPSKDGLFIAYAVADAGSDWQTWRIRDVISGQDLPDELRQVKFSDCAWLPDGSGFFYSRFPVPLGEAMEERLANQTLWFHKRGTPQSEDVLVHEEPDHPDRGFTGTVSEDGKRLVITVTQGTEEKTRIYLHDIASLKLKQRGGRAGGRLRKVLDAFDANYLFVDITGDRALFLTDRDAPRGRVVSIDVTRPDPAGWTTIVPESSATITSVSAVGGHLLVNDLDRAHSRVRVFTPDGAQGREIALPGLGTVTGLAGDAASPETFFTFAGYTTPPSVYRLDVATGDAVAWHEPKVDFDPSRYETVQVEYPSKDGTMIPMFITARKGTPRDGKQPTLLYGYGGFNIPLTPTFKVADLMWLELGGVFAVANLRGGGEFGRAWHEAGIKQNKQNVFDDFIAAAEHLIREGWTSTPRLAIHGRSNGGLLVGATLVQRPDLFGAAIPSVGVLDMLRYHRFTIGWAWASDYGTCEESPEMFRYLLNYSPVHQAERPQAFPPTLITTADHDDRVVPPHSYKFAAALQHSQTAADPILIRIETRAGHGAGTPVSMLVEEVADKYAFLVDALGFEPRGI